MMYDVLQHTSCSESMCVWNQKAYHIGKQWSLSPFLVFSATSPKFTCRARAVEIWETAHRYQWLSSCIPCGTSRAASKSLLEIQT